MHVQNNQSCSLVLMLRNKWLYLVGLQKECICCWYWILKCLVVRLIYTHQQFVQCIDTQYPQQCNQILCGGTGGGVYGRVFNEDGAIGRGRVISDLVWHCNFDINSIYIKNFVKKCFCRKCC